MSPLFRSLALVLALFASPSALADILIFQSSDNHSEYGEIPNYVKSTSALARQFQAANPGAPVLHLVNGDLAGPSQWTNFEKGALNYYVLAQLGRHYPVVLNLGNHEAFDFIGETGNSLFRQQLLRYKKRTGGVVRNANVEPGAAGSDLFEPFEDLVSPSGKKIRVVGLVLDQLFSYSTYSTTAPTQIINRVIPMLEEAKAQLRRAAVDGVPTVIFQCHEAFLITQEMLQRLLEWKATQPELAGVDVPTVFAAHDHEVHNGKVGETMLIDSGSIYEYTQVVLDDDGRVKSFEHMSRARQKEFAANNDLLPGEKLAVRATEKVLTAVMKLNAGVIASPIAEFTETRTELKQARQPLGIKLASAMVDWARDVLKAEGTQVAGVLAMYNSGTYRGTKPVAAGDLTLGQLKQMYPFPGKAVLVLVPGSRAQEMSGASAPTASRKSSTRRRSPTTCARRATSRSSTRARTGPGRRSSQTASTRSRSTRGLA
jgi:2',3'-cyclic-nucleotide 2'-phosphodiesterase (5'-nucleotidase family)